LSGDNAWRGLPEDDDVCLGVRGVRDQLYVLTTGGHDSYGIVGVFRGPPGADVDALAARWAEEHPELTRNLGSCKNGKEYFDHEHFRAFVLERARLEPVEFAELYLPDYSRDMGRHVKAGREKGAGK
jgi:hypothetical protein